MSGINIELLTSATGEYAERRDQAIINAIGRDAIDATYGGATISDHAHYWDMVEAIEKNTQASLGKIGGYWLGSVEPGEITVKSVKDTTELTADQLDGMTTLKASVGSEGVTVTKKVIMKDAETRLMKSRAETPEDADIAAIEVFLALINHARVSANPNT